MGTQNKEQDMREAQVIEFAKQIARDDLRAFEASKDRPEQRFLDCDPVWGGEHTTALADHLGDNNDLTEEEIDLAEKTYARETKRAVEEQEETEPTSLRALKEQMEAGHYEDWSSLPTFGGEAPADTSCVWSWDEDSLLEGTCGDDLKIVPREVER